MNSDYPIAYFSMEVAVEAQVPTYAGGLGILAGDTLRAAADEGVAMVAVSLLHRKGYLNQSFDQSGWQREVPADWPVEKYLTEMSPRVVVHLENRTVSLRAWKYDVTGLSKIPVPVFFLDADLPENSTWDRTLTHFLYGGDNYYRLCQEVILGLGGVRMLRALGFEHIRRFHMNEGHSSLLTLELLAEEAQRANRSTIIAADVESVKRHCIFTTHTPVASGHDQFPMDLVGKVLRNQEGFYNIQGVFCAHVLGRILQHEPSTYDPTDIFRREYVLNLTYLALNLCHYVNGVAKSHAEVSRRMFSKYHIDEITNGVHAGTWVCPAFHSLFDRHVPGWEGDNFSLRYALNIPRQEVWAAHEEAKRQLSAYVLAATKTALAPEVLTLGFARRFATYKRADLLLSDLERLKSVAVKTGGVQIIYAGKAHPNDEGGKAIIQHIMRVKDTLSADVRIVYLENYDMNLGRLLTAGVDVWLNTPLPPLEASGTSGMKAALNGVPSLSILDGWWLEGCIEGFTGWSIGERPTEIDANDTRNQPDAKSLYDRLETVVAPCFYADRERFIDIMRHSIALNGSFFNTQRMIQQYVEKAYL
jgi:starch phosphorylase